MAYPETVPTPNDPLTEDTWGQVLNTAVSNIDNRLNDVEADLDYGVHVVVLNASDQYIYRGQVVTARPADIADYEQGGIMRVDTSQHVDVVTPPGLTGGQDGDEWVPHPDAEIAV